LFLVLETFCWIFGWKLFLEQILRCPLQNYTNVPSTLINMFSKNSYFDRTVLLMLIALEALLFYTFYYREIAWYPPQYFDQTAFLTESYRLQERIHEDGLGTLWMAVTRQGAPNGWLLHIEGALSGLFFGGGRLPQLLINFLAFDATDSRLRNGSGGLG
jgi:hypothetical protein